MSEISFEIPIPLDEDGFIEMECDYCKSRFMLHENVFKNEDYLHFFCPVCGLPNNTQSFYCPEVLDKAEQMIGNYMTDYMNQLFSDFNKSNNNDFFSTFSFYRSSYINSNISCTIYENYFFIKFRVITIL